METAVKTVFITGASAGIGEACAEVFAREGYRLLLAARRADRLEDLKRRLHQDFPADVHILELDVRDKAAVEAAVNGLPEEWKAIDVLINNAGLSQGLEPLHEGDADDWDRMIDTNIKGLLYVTRTVSPGMVSRRSGHIINIGSIAGKEVYPNGNVYCATKHAVEALTKGMRIDFLKHGVRVTAIHPGAVETEFSVVRFKGDETRAAKVYDGFVPLYAMDIAEAVWFAASRPAHVNVQDMLIMPAAQANATMISRQ